MPTIKKNSKAKVHHKAENDLQKAINAIHYGAKLQKNTFWNKTEYLIEYPEGGCFFITKTVFDRLIKTQ